MTSTTKLTELTGDYALDPALTRVGFVARHTMATKVPGRFEAFEGLTFEGTVPINRRDWGAHWSAAGFLVSKQVLVQLAVTAIRHS